jgi:hypothetical protein
MAKYYPSKPEDDARYEWSSDAERAWQGIKNEFYRIVEETGLSLAQKNLLHDWLEPILKWDRQWWHGEHAKLVEVLASNARMLARGRSVDSLIPWTPYKPRSSKGNAVISYSMVAVGVAVIGWIIYRSANK